MTRENHDPYAEIDQAFFADGYRLAASNLEDNLTRDSLLAHLKTQYSVIDSLLEAFQHRVESSGSHIDCRRGCSWCCHQQVLVMPAEMLLIADYIRTNFDDEAKESILSRAIEKDEKVQSLTAERALQVKIPCPLLQDGSCSVYAVRPMACRIYLSSDLNSCLQEFHQPEKPDVYPQLFDFPLHAGRMMNSGLIHYLKEKGISVHENRLEKILRLLLENPDKGSNWLSGSDDFGEGHEQVEEIVRLREKA
ncbi:YkgJ family cysteine cluster protein [Prolixibacter denitrificans]|nr:YkgJ family cysteine cluster protein [Prolixibacter denitrificans]PSK84473.1 putative zinc- or iron-chelating protein [Prolixibacter denitrificans]